MCCQRKLRQKIQRIVKKPAIPEVFDLNFQRLVVKDENDKNIDAICLIIIF